MRLYIAGPYSPPDGCTLHDAARVAQRNTSLAIDIGIQLMRKGHIVYIPHLSHYIHLRVPNDMANFGWYEFDNSFIDHWAEALYYIAPSKGADAEKLRAGKLGLKVYTRIEDVPDHA